MSYSQALMTTYDYGHKNDLGNGTPEQWSFRGPPGKVGMIIDMGIHVTETFACDATDAKMEIGTSSDPDAYCLMNIPDGTAATDTFSVINDTDAIISEAIPADTQIEFKSTVGVDAGTEAGIGYQYVSVLWY